ncbi:hypothetical protein AGDE_15808 [Angomonas deanei]|nr:hypothetical protein AGDE_15808 [Angomonas deanei]|eukprot:EPY18366.1 hypothetical protein AGDE_15808 [Angomonas deanei]
MFLQCLQEFEKSKPADSSVRDAANPKRPRPPSPILGRNEGNSAPSSSSPVLQTETKQNNVGSEKEKPPQRAVLSSSTTPPRQNGVLADPTDTTMNSQTEMKKVRHEEAPSPHPNPNNNSGPPVFMAGSSNVFLAPRQPYRMPSGGIPYMTMPSNTPHTVHTPFPPTYPGNIPPPHYGGPLPRYAWNPPPQTVHQPLPYQANTPSPQQTRNLSQVNKPPSQTSVPPTPVSTPYSPPQTNHTPPAGTADPRAALMRALAMSPWSPAEDEKCPAMTAPRTAPPGVRFPTAEEEQTVPLRHVAVPPLPLEQLRSRFNKKTQNRFNRLWGQCILPVRSNPSHAPAQTLRCADAEVLVAAGMIAAVPPSASPTRGWVAPFTILMEATGERRFMPWPLWGFREEEVKDAEEFKIQVPHIKIGQSDASAAIVVEDACQRLELPPGCRAFYRLTDEKGTLFELTRLPPTCPPSAEMLHLLLSALVKTPTVSLPHLVSKGRSKVVVCVDRVLFYGETQRVKQGKDECVREAQSAGITFHHAQEVKLESDFLGIHHDHIQRSVSLSDSFIRKIAHSLPFNQLTLSELEVFLSRVLYADPVMDFQLYRYYFLFKMMRRCFSSVFKKETTMGATLQLSPSQMKLLKLLYCAVLRNTKREVRQYKEGLIAGASRGLPVVERLWRPPLP